MPLYGNELDRDTNPYEAGLGRVVKLDKAGDFVGRAALEKVAADGPRRQLVGLTLRGRAIARHGYPVHRAGRGGRAAWSPVARLSPTLGVPIAMGYVPPADARSVPWSRSPSAPAVPGGGRPVAVLQASRSPSVQVPDGSFGGLHDQDHEAALSAIRSAMRPVVGITAYAADELGDIVFVELPAVGASSGSGAIVRRDRVGQDSV